MSDTQVFWVSPRGLHSINEAPWCEIYSSEGWQVLDIEYDICKVLVKTKQNKSPSCQRIILSRSSGCPRAYIWAFHECVRELWLFLFIGLISLQWVEIDLKIGQFSLWFFFRKKVLIKRRRKTEYKCIMSLKEMCNLIYLFYFN